MISDNGGVWKYLQIITMGLGTGAITLQAVLAKVGWGRKQHLAWVSDQA